MIRETWGHSWRFGPGERRWRSTSIYISPWQFLFGGLLWYLFVVPYVLLFWACIEFYVVIISGLIVLFRWWLVPATRYRISWDYGLGFWYLTTKGRELI